MSRPARIATIVCMDTTTYGPVTDQRPTTGTWGWLAVAFASLVISVPADLFILLAFTENCSQPPDPIDVLHGQIAMLVVLLVAALPWMVMLPLSRNRGHGLLIGLVALLPAIGFVIHGYTDGAWTSSICFG
jgi:hypothetical protein